MQLKYLFPVENKATGLLGSRVQKSSKLANSGRRRMEIRNSEFVRIPDGRASCIFQARILSSCREGKIVNRHEADTICMVIVVPICKSQKGSCNGGTRCK